MPDCCVELKFGGTQPRGGWYFDVGSMNPLFSAHWPQGWEDKSLDDLPVDEAGIFEYLQKRDEEYEKECVRAMRYPARQVEGNGSQTQKASPVTLHRWRGYEDSCRMDVIEQTVWTEPQAYSTVTFAAPGRLVKSGQTGFYEIKLLSGSGCIQAGWATKRFEQKSSDVSMGVGDELGTWSVDGTRKVGSLCSPQSKNPGPLWFACTEEAIRR